MCACVQDQLVVCTNILFITIHGITNWLFKQTLIRIHGKTPFYNCGCLHLMRSISKRLFSLYWFNPLNPELNPICYLLALLGAHHFLHVVCCECRVLSGRGLCDELITRPEESYRLCCGPAARLLRSWVRIPPGHGYLSVVSVVCCQVEVSATS